MGLLLRLRGLLEAVPPHAFASLFGMANTHLVQPRQVTLDALLVRVEHLLDDRIGMHTRSSAELEAYKSQILDGMVYKLSATVLAEKIVDKRITRSHVFEHKVIYPRSWWQHFKQDVLDKTWLTRWFVDWRPVKLKAEYKREVARLECNFRQYRKYPAADIVLAPPSVHKNVIVTHEDMGIYWSHDGR